MRIWFLSADNPDNIRGYGFQGIVVDEAASIPPDVWNYVLRPTIGQTMGWAVLISTPKGRNWFFDMFTRGMEPGNPDHKSFRFASNESPYFPAQEWEDARRTLPQDVFRQEYEAEFLEDSAGVFHNIEACLTSDIRPPTGEVVIGCDVAKHTDFTVLIAMDSRTGQCFDMERFNRLDWPIQKERIVAFARKHRGRLILDATGAGDPIYDDLVRVYPNITPFRFTAHSKVELIQRLVVAVEQRRMAWPRAWEVLTNEMKRFEYRLSPSGQLSYNAPDGYHDDCVIALGLANHGFASFGLAGNFHAFAPRARPHATLTPGPLALRL
ncbi:MAG: terminase family protein [Candidatus Hydrogenedentes bacterium]|nr:terminase family protein [Candidatus Hydrogenedentota bacterium]